MTSLGCLIALTWALAPRVALLGAWILADRWALVWGGDILAPLLGFAFLPYTAIMYYLVWVPEGVVGYAWAWLLFGLLLDLASWGHYLIYRRAGREYFERYYSTPVEAEPRGDSASDLSGDSAT